MINAHASDQDCAAGILLECRRAYPSEEIERTLDSLASTVEDVPLEDHGRLHALVAEELLYRPDVVPIHQHVGREGVPQCRRVSPERRTLPALSRMLLG